MKTKILFASALATALISGTAIAATTQICNNAAGAGTAPAAGTPGTHYMATAITPKCSANVYLQGKDGTNGATYGVAAASAKGKNIYAGDTQSGGLRGGGVAGAAQLCAVQGGCTNAEVTTALANVAS